MLITLVTVLNIPEMKYLIVSNINHLFYKYFSLINSKQTTEIAIIHKNLIHPLDSNEISIVKIE